TVARRLPGTRDIVHDTWSASLVCLLASQERSRMSQPPTALSGSGPLRLRAPERGGLAQRVYEALKEGLLFEEILPETKLNLDQIARDRGVSNPPVREALGQLEADGLVRKEAYKGYTALPQLDEDLIDEMYEFRLVLEPHIAAVAAERRSEQEMHELE